MTVGSAQPGAPTAALGEASTSVAPALPGSPASTGENEQSGEGSNDWPPVDAGDGGIIGETGDGPTQTVPAPSTSSGDAPGETDSRPAQSDTLSDSSSATFESSEDGHTDNTSELGEPNLSEDGGVTDVTTEATGETTTGAEATPMNTDALIAALPGCDTHEKTVVRNADLLDFETTPDSALHVGALIVGDAGETLDAVLAAYQDDTGSSTLQWVSGANGTARALSLTNPSASARGGGVALVVECLDASHFEGVEFWMRGHKPVGSMVFSVYVSLTQSASVDIALESEWTRYRVPFNRLRTQGRRGTDVGRSLRALVWSSDSRDGDIALGADDWRHEAGAFEIAVDEIRFF